MNMINSHSLLLCVFLCMSNLLLAFNGTPTERSKTSNKELIIINVDEELSSSLDDLAKYVHHLFDSKKESQITIKRYINESDVESRATVSDLVTLLIENGITADHIKVKDEPLKLTQPYFTIAVSEVPEVQ